MNLLSHEGKLERDYSFFTILSMALAKEFVLNNEIKMPAIGFGTYRIRNGDVVMKVVDYALNAGYRLFDTAAVYGNEQHLKEAFKKLLPKYGLERKDIFITTKLSPSDHGGYDLTENAFKKSLEYLGSEYVDLYLIHFPGTAKHASGNPQNLELRSKSWSKLAEIYDEGHTKAIGVSNYTVRHLSQLLADNHGVNPAVNQVEWHPYYYQEELLQCCKQNNIVLQAYCSLGGASNNDKKLLEEPIVLSISGRLGVTPSQLLLSWALHKGVAVIPKSTNPEHIKQNFTLNFNISPDDMKSLDALGENGIKYAWDPSVVA